MKIDKIGFIANFIAENTENLDNLEDSLIQLNKDPENEELILSIARILHAVKGSSKIMEYEKIEHIVELLENLFKEIKNSQQKVSPLLIQLFISVSESLRQTLKKIENGSEDDVDSYELIVSNIENAINGDDFITVFTEDSQNISKNVRETIVGSKSIRVDVEKVDGIIQEFDKLIMREFNLKNQFNTLLTSLSKTSEDKDLKLCREIKETLEVLETQCFSLQESVISMRMLGFDMILQPFKRNLINEVLESGKNVEVDIPKTDISIDKLILERMPDILVQLVRNSLEHGIESEEERLALGKSKNGKIGVYISQSANRVLITVSDDGKGLDYEKIREIAIKQNPLRTLEIQAMNQKSLVEFLFSPGFSTNENSSKKSETGMGLNIIRDEVDKLKGKINVESEKGKGTSFIVSMPLSLAAQDALYVVCGGRKMLILSHYIKEIVSITYSQLVQLQTGMALPNNNELVPFFESHAVFGGESQQRSKDSIIHVIVLEYLERKIAIVIDKILNYTTIVVKPVPPVFKKFTALQGFVFDEEYTIVPILNIPDIMRRFKLLREYDVINNEVRSKAKTYCVLIADDSETTRHIEQVIFETEHYNVVCALDGIDALEKIKNQHFDLIVTDSQMPRMDGFDLIHNLRHSEEYKNIPIIMISSSGAEASKKAMEEGASCYIVKGDFEREALIAKAKELLNE